MEGHEEEAADAEGSVEENPKPNIEIRNKFKYQNRMTETRFGHSIFAFEFVSDFDIRIPCFCSALPPS